MQNKDPEQPMAVRRMSQAEISHGKGEWTRRNQKRGGTCGMVEQNGETRHGISEPETSKAMRDATDAGRPTAGRIHRELKM